MTKKLIIPRESLPYANAYTRNYEVRYRITTEDRNRFSYWSPIVSVNPEFVYEVGTLELRGQISLEKIGSSYVGITWDSVSIYKKVGDDLSYLGELPEYDIWIRWAGSGGATPSEWENRGRISSTSLNVNVPDTYPYTDPSTGIVSDVTPRYIYVEVYRPVNPSMRYEETREFPQNSTIINTTDDYFYFPTGHGTTTGTSGLYHSDNPIGGFSDGGTYYTRTIDYYRVSFHPTKQDAIDNTNKIDLTGTPTGTGSFTGFTFRMYDAVLTTL